MREDKADKIESLPYRIHVGLIFLRYIVKYRNYFSLQIYVAFMILPKFLSGLPPCLIHPWSVKFLFLLNFNSFLPLYDLYPHFFPIGLSSVGTITVPISFTFFSLIALSQCIHCPFILLILHYHQ